MITATTALFVRTLRVETRLFRGYGLRVLLGAVVLFILATLQATAFMRSAAGLDLVRTIVWSAFACITLAGVSSFCSAITEEKEEGTLGLMRLAGLDPVAILLGKSTARLWEALLLCATMLPFATLAVTLGGVSLGQVLACVVALGAYVVMLANLGLLWSVLLRTSPGASSAMTLALIVLLLAPVALSAAPLSGPWRPLGIVAGWLSRASVVDQLNAALMTGASGPLVGAQAWIDLAIAVAAFGLAWLAFDRFAGGDTESEPRRAVMRRRSRLNVLGLPRPRPGLAALAWKDFHFACGGRPLLAVKLALAAALGVWLVWLGRESPRQYRDAGEGIMVIALLWGGVEIGAHLARVFAHEVRGQTLDGVMTLPYGVAAIAYTKLRALLPALLPAAILFVVGAAMAPASFAETVREIIHRPEGPLVVAAGVVYFWHSCAWLSLVLKRAALAAAVALSLVTWLVVGAGIALLETVLRVRDEDVTVVLILALLLVPSVGMHLAILRRLRAKAAG